MPRIAVVKFSQLGTACWSPERFLDRCYTCGRYDTCKLPVRIPNAPYDNKLAKARRLKVQSDKIFSELKEMKN